MNLVLDFGNSYKKMAIVENNSILHLSTEKNISLSQIKEIALEFPVRQAILSSVLNAEEDLLNYLEENFSFVHLTEKTPLPIKNNYQTPETLGYDRIAATVAASDICKENPILVIQMGSCITYNFLDETNQFLGGAISPGLSMRLKALNCLTEKLPQIDYKPIDFFLGRNTKDGILSGVFHGIVSECNAFIDMYKTLNKDVAVFLTGGDMKLFENSLKNITFAISNLVLLGLHKILDYNVNLQK